MSANPAYPSVADAMAAVQAGLRFLAAADATQMSVQSQAECLRDLERADAISMAVRASVLSAFTAARGYHDDADYSARAWLVHRTQITPGAASGHTAWARRFLTHPKVVAALAAGEVSESVGRVICRWTDKLPEDHREDGDQILLDAAAGGLGLEDLAALFAAMYEKVRAEVGDDDDGQALRDRSVRLATTIGGAGVMHGDLTADCAEAVGRVLDALSAPAGDEDERTQEQRYHDALQEALRRLIGANLLPERAGQPVKIWAHISLADLLRLDGSSALQEEWTAELRTRWAAHRAAASEGAGLEGAWLDGDAAEAIACDACITPIVTGDVNPAIIEGLIHLCVELDRLEANPDCPSSDTTLAREALEQAIIGKTINLLQLSISTFDLRRLLVWSGADAVAFSGVRSGSQFSPGFPCGPLHCGDHDRVPRFRLPPLRTRSLVCPGIGWLMGRTLAYCGTVTEAPIAPCRGRPMSSIESAPAAIPATRHATTRRAFTLPGPPARTCPATRPPSPARCASAITGTSPGMRDQIRVIKGCVRPGRALQQSHVTGALPDSAAEASQLLSSQFRGHLSR